MKSFSLKKNGEGKIKSSLKIFNRTSVVKNFLAKIKSGCFEDRASYNVVAGYFISAMLNSLSRFIKSNYEVQFDEKSEVNSREFFLITLELCFYMFTINPQITNSIKLSMICYVSFSFFDKKIPSESNTIKLHISNQIYLFFESGSCKKLIDKTSDYFPIEIVNLLFVSRNMGGDYLLSPKLVKDYFSLDKLPKKKDGLIYEDDSDYYFKIISILYYIGNEPDYNEIKKTVIDFSIKKLSSLIDIKEDAQKCFLFFDFMSCPYISDADKDKVGKIFCRQLLKVDGGRVAVVINELKSRFWFVSWDYPDLWSTLEKKELKSSY